MVEIVRSGQNCEVWPDYRISSKILNTNITYSNRNCPIIESFTDDSRTVTVLGFISSSSVLVSGFLQKTCISERIGYDMVYFRIKHEYFLTSKTIRFDWMIGFVFLSLSYGSERCLNVIGFIWDDEWCWRL